MVFVLRIKLRFVSISGFWAHDDHQLKVVLPQHRYSAYTLSPVLLLRSCE